MKLKINNMLYDSDTIEVETDADGKIKDKFWRRRLKDSKIDGCVKILKHKRQEKAK